jgi:hypothetical protein
LDNFTMRLEFTPSTHRKFIRISSPCATKQPEGKGRLP